MKRLLVLAAAAVSFFSTSVASAQSTVFDNTNTITNGLSFNIAANPTMIIGDALGLTQSGILGTVAVPIFNAAGGDIITGTMTINVYDNTTPYVSGSLAGTRPLLATVNVPVDFTANPLPVGFFDFAINDFTAQNILVPQNIIVTQQFAMTSGTSTSLGSVLGAGTPDIGTSPSDFYLNTTTFAEGLYVAGSSQLAYYVEVTPVPEPVTTGFALFAGLGGLAFLRRKFKKGA